jgi:hypothetical protein
MDVSSTDINTKGFDALLNLVENTSHDSFDLYYGLFLYNANATGGCCCLSLAVYEGGLGVGGASDLYCGLFLSQRQRDRWVLLLPDRGREVEALPARAAPA